MRRLRGRITAVLRGLRSKHKRWYAKPKPQNMSVSQIAAIVLGCVVFASVLGAVALAAICSLPANYFRSDWREKPGVRKSRFVILLRNIIGLIVVLGGAILVLPVFPLPPGSSICTILCGVLLMEFPSKRRILVRLVSAPGVLRILNVCRRTMGSPPFEC